MKRWPTVIFIIICLIDFCCLGSVFLYAQYQGDEDIEIRVWNLKEQVKIEEEAIRALKIRHAHIVKEKERIKKVIEREKIRVRRIEKDKKLKRELFEVKRQREQERQLSLLEQLMLNQAEKKKSLERIEERRMQLIKQKHEQEEKLSKEERGLQELELELINHREQKRLEQMQLELEAAGRGYN